MFGPGDLQLRPVYEAAIMQVISITDTFARAVMYTGILFGTKKSTNAASTIKRS